MSWQGDASTPGSGSDRTDGSRRVLRSREAAAHCGSGDEGAGGRSAILCRVSSWAALCPEGETRPRRLGALPTSAIHGAGSTPSTRIVASEFILRGREPAPLGETASGSVRTSRFFVPESVEMLRGRGRVERRTSLARLLTGSNGEGHRSTQGHSGRHESNTWEEESFS